MRRGEKRCYCCGEVFESDPRQKNEQKTCGKIECQKQRRRENSRRWRRKNKDYYKERYASYGKEWLKNHPGYLKDYRRNHPDYVEVNRQKQKQRDLKRKKQPAANNLDKQIALPQESSVNTPKITELDWVSHLDKRIARRLKFLVLDGKTAKLAPFLDIQIALDKKDTECYSNCK